MKNYYVHALSCDLLMPVTAFRYALQMIREGKLAKSPLELGFYYRGSFFILC